MAVSSSASGASRSSTISEPWASAGGQRRRSLRSAVDERAGVAREGADLRPGSEWAIVDMP